MRDIIFDQFEFSISKLVFNTRYKHPKSQNNNLLYLLTYSRDYKLIYFFAKLEITKRNIDKFTFYLLIKSISKKFLYYNKNR